MSSRADTPALSQRWLRPFRQRWGRWLGRRLPPSIEVVLTQRRLFIFPSYAGLAFLFMLLVMLIAAINYQNNMAYALTFLLGSVFVVAVHHTFANLHRLKLRFISADSVFPGQQAAFAIRLSASGNRRYQGWLPCTGRVGEIMQVTIVVSYNHVLITITIQITGSWCQP